MATTPAGRASAARSQQPEAIPRARRLLPRGGRLEERAQDLGLELAPMLET